MPGRRVLMVVTNHPEITHDHPTGIWLPEFTEPYTLFCQAGYDVTVASLQGGRAPIDPRSLPETADEETSVAMKELENTLPLRDVDTAQFDAIFLPGGHGTMYDLPASGELASVLRSFYESGRVIAAVCHGPAGLLGATLADGSPLVRGKRPDHRAESPVERERREGGHRGSERALGRQRGTPPGPAVSSLVPAGVRGALRRPERPTASWSGATLLTSGATSSAPASGSPRPARGAKGPARPRSPGRACLSPGSPGPPGRRSRSRCRG